MIVLEQQAEALLLCAKPARMTEKSGIDDLKNRSYGPRP
jgi:hypothetical protein